MTMNRRSLLRRAVAAAALPVLPSPLRRNAWSANASIFRRVRPSDPSWPDPGMWERLNREVGGRLIKAGSPLSVCRDAPDGAPCGDLFRELKNPYYIGDQVGLTQTAGWVDAWIFQPGVYAVAAETTADVVAAVNFARENNLRLVVKGGGHSYLGRSNAPDSLLIWTRHMNAVAFNDDFVPQECAGQQLPQPAVTVGAGAIWMHTYNQVTTKDGRYVQGGGCGTVGVAGLVQAGGFGSFSKNFGTAAAGLLEAEIVTADGAVRIANACTNPDLFWGLRGGGGGSLGVVTRLTLKTHELQPFFGAVFATIHAFSEGAFRRLIGRFIDFYADTLLNPQWGETVTIRPGDNLDIRMVFQGLDRRQAEMVWQPFFHWVTGSPQDFSYRLTPRIVAVPARNFWDPTYLRAHVPGAVLSDDRTGAPEDNIFWAGNLSEVGHFLSGFQSLWLPASLLQPDARSRLADALFAAARHWSVELHFQKGLAGGSDDAVSATRGTAMNPDVLNGFALAIVAGEDPPVFPGLPSHEPDLVADRRQAGEIGKAMNELKRLAPGAGSYFAESDFFETGWQTSYWGANYPRLRSIKEKYDPSGLFFVHHGVGSEEWSADGFTRLTPP
jgi:FAD/FMN-containing dehydrogenase